MTEDVQQLFDEIMSGVTECPECGEPLELDGVCHCGGKFLKEGLI